jgi:hypothetical protein
MITTGNLVKRAEVFFGYGDFRLEKDIIPDNLSMYLDATAEMFVNWLRRYVRDSGLFFLVEKPHLVPDEGGTINLSLYDPHLEAHRTAFPEEMPTHVTLEMSHISPQRIEVRPHCKERVAREEYVILLLQIRKAWPGALGSFEEQIDWIRAEREKLDKEITLRLIGNEEDDVVDERVRTEVENWLAEHAAGAYEEPEVYGNVIEIQLFGNELTLWQIVCTMSESWPALQPEVLAALTPRMSAGLAERISKEDLLWLREWLEGHPELEDSDILLEIIEYGEEYRRKPGRPRDPDNEWAYEQVRELGRDRRDVYEEWLQRPRIRDKNLVDPLDSFNKAIKVRKKKR